MHSHRRVTIAGRILETGRSAIEPDATCDLEDSGYRARRDSPANSCAISPAAARGASKKPPAVRGAAGSTIRAESGAGWACPRIGASSSAGSARGGQRVS